MTEYLDTTTTLSKADEIYVAKLMTLFEGFSEAHGTYDSGTLNPFKGGKLEIKSTARTVRLPVTIELWLDHVRGARPLGIIPIRANDTCMWGVIDIDEYDLDHTELINQLERRQLPLVVCRTKSGGAHLFLFFSEPVAAVDLRRRLQEIAALIGHGSAEVFPKQTRVDHGQGHLGNWLNMPYLGGDKTDRYGVKPRGTAMGLYEFVDYAESKQQKRDFLEKSWRKRPEKDPEFGDGPPCLQHLAAEGIPQGGRNKTLFNMGIFVKKKYGARWEAVLEEWNRKYFGNDPLPAREVQDVIKSLSRKEYFFTCREHPMVSHCDSHLCRSRRFGVGGMDDMPVVSSLSVLNSDPPVWFLEVDGESLQLDTDQLMNFRQFQRLCLERRHVAYRTIKQDTWFQIISEHVRNVTVIDVPIEVGIPGIFYEFLREFLLSRHTGDQREDMLLGKPFKDIENNRYCFRLKDLHAFLEKQNFKYYTRPQMTAQIRKMGGGDDFFNIKGSGINFFFVPMSFATVDPKTSLPPIAPEPI